MKKLNHIVFAGFFLSALVLGFSTSVGGSLPQKKILLFSSEDVHLPGLMILEDAIRSTFGKDPTHRVTFYNEALDNARIPNEKYEKEYVDLLRRKYEGEKIDLIFVRSPSGIRFLLKHQAEIFNGVPKVFTTNDQRELAGVDLGSDFTGVFSKIDYGPTLDLILKQRITTKKVLVVTGSAPQEVAFRDQAKNEFAPYAGRLEIDYVSELSIPDLQNEVASLPPNSVCLFISYLRDPAGNGYSIPEAISMVLPSASVPVYAVADSAMGTGVVGGSMLSYQLIGERSGELGLRILSGEKPSDIPPQTVESVPIFDWRQLRRWNISEETLPAGSIVRFKEPTAWEQYKWQIIGLGAFSIFQTLLIGWLLFIRERRQQAEKESLRFAALARDEHQKLNDVVANVPGIVWESHLESGPDDRRIEFVSNYVEKMLGYTPEEMVSKPNFWKSVVLEDDQEELTQTTGAILAGEQQGLQQFRCVAKDGRLVWADAHLAPTFDEAGNVTGIRGVAIDVTDRKTAEEAVRESEARFRNMADSAPVLIWMSEVSPLISFVNKFGIDYTGLSQEQLKGEAWLDAIHEDDRQRCVDIYIVSYEFRQPFNYEYRIRAADGEFQWFYCTSAPRFAVNGEFLGYVGTCVNINDRKKAEEALAESEERYRNVVETQTELICRYLPDTTLTFVNDAYCRYFGKTHEELIGSKFAELIPSHARDAALSHITSLIENPRTEMYEHEVILPNGTRGWQQWIDSRVETLNGDPIEIQGIGRDITEKRQVEEALRASENRFRIMADSAPVLIWMCGPDKLCTYVNQGWMDFTGRSIDMEIGNGWTAGIHPEDSDRMFEIFNSAFDRTEPFKLEYRLRSADGAFHWLYDSGTPRFSSDGEFLGYIGSCVDISDRKKAEEESKRAHDEVVRLQKQLQEENVYLREVIKLEHNFEEIIGRCDALKYVLFKIEQVAPTDATVLITGETGTGKELVARAIHSTSPRKNRPLVKVNCAALSASLIESELFGHERGAFTGASARKIGRFELADGATIFLDEVGELPLELQSKLLRVLQEGEFERLGSSKTIKADVRIIAATNRNLEKEVTKGTFRGDLLFRLNVFPITVPPLRERKDDIPELIEYFVNRFSKKIGKSIRSVSPATVRTLCKHSWPGNIRELANVIERSVINTQTENLQVLETFEPFTGAAASSASVETLEDMERKYITEILDKSGWKIEGSRGAAQILGLNPSTLRTRIAKLGISKPKNNEKHLLGTSRS